MDPVSEHCSTWHAWLQEEHLSKQESEAGYCTCDTWSVATLPGSCLFFSLSSDEQADRDAVEIDATSMEPLPGGETSGRVGTSPVGLGADESLLEVGVDDARSLGRCHAGGDGPGPRLLRQGLGLGLG